MSETRQCTGCNGTGQIDYVDENGPGKDTCPSCGGSGRVPK